MRTITNGTLTLTDNEEQEAVSAYRNTPVNVQNFVASCRQAIPVQ